MNLFFFIYRFSEIEQLLQTIECDDVSIKKFCHRICKLLNVLIFFLVWFMHEHLIGNNKAPLKKIEEKNAHYGSYRELL